MKPDYIIKVYRSQDQREAGLADFEILDSDGNFVCKKKDVIFKHTFETKIVSDDIKIIEK
jgi:hypothetical protein